MSIQKPSPLKLQPSFGFGDRIGLATPGHVEAMKRFGNGIAPIFAQQSIREMNRAGRSPEQVMKDAMNGMEAAGWDGIHGADADHLKTSDDVDRTVAAGFTFFTIDPSDHVDRNADSYDEDALRVKFAAVRHQIDWLDRYKGRRIPLDTGKMIEIDEAAAMRAVVKYGRALNRGIELAGYIKAIHEKEGKDFDLELSVDETEQPTSLAEHYIIAHQCSMRGVKLTSLAPRFIGTTEKGIDYIGDVDELEKSLRHHAAIADKFGPYKLSLHSGSDKLSMYPAFARATEGRFHVKTAGTSYLEALRVVAIHEPSLFRLLCNFSRLHYDEDKTSYHVHATLRNVPEPVQISGAKDLEQFYLECWEDVPEGKGFTAEGRQILHCTFGSALSHPETGSAIRECLMKHSDTYAEVLAIHFGKHLEALRAGM